MSHGRQPWEGQHRAGYIAGPGPFCPYRPLGGCPWYALRCLDEEAPASRSRIWSQIQNRDRWRRLTKGGYISIEPSVGNGLYRVGIISHHPPIDTYKAGVAGSSPAPPTTIFRACAPPLAATS